MAENIVTGKSYKVNTGNNSWDKVSFWTKASDVENNNGQTLQSTVGNIVGLSNNLVTTAGNYALDATQGKALNDKLGGLAFSCDSNGEWGYTTPEGEWKKFGSNGGNSGYPIDAIRLVTVTCQRAGTTSTSQTAIVPTDGLLVINTFAYTNGVATRMNVTINGDTFDYLNNQNGNGYYMVTAGTTVGLSLQISTGGSVNTGSIAAILMPFKWRTGYIQNDIYLTELPYPLSGTGGKYTITLTDDWDMLFVGTDFARSSKNKADVNGFSFTKVPTTMEESYWGQVFYYRNAKAGDVVTIDCYNLSALYGVKIPKFTDANVELLLQYENGAAPTVTASKDYKCVIGFGARLKRCYFSEVSTSRQVYATGKTDNDGSQWGAVCLVKSVEQGNNLTLKTSNDNFGKIIIGIT